jgi:hypothetical protein
MQSVPGVTSTRTTIVLGTLKETSRLPLPAVSVEEKTAKLDREKTA